MRYSLALVVVASLGLFACGAATKEEAKSADDVNVWKGYTGEYASSSSEYAKPSFSKAAGSPLKKDAANLDESAEAKPAPKQASKAAKEAPAPVAEEDEKPLFVAAKKPASKGTVKGESISGVSVDQLAAGAMSATKSKSVVSSGTMTGARYEVVTVETKKGTIKITRPAATPNPKGPEVTPPTNKLGDIGKNESAWFDEEGDCIVVVSAPKKAAAAKLLNSIVKH